MTPNAALEPTPTGNAFGPRSALVYAALRGTNALPGPAAQLKPRAHSAKLASLRKAFSPNFSRGRHSTLFTLREARLNMSVHLDALRHPSAARTPGASRRVTSR
jgi:hypothetical protein